MIEQYWSARLKSSSSLRFSLTRAIGPSSEAEASATGEAMEKMGSRKTARVAAENFILMSGVGEIIKRLGALMIIVKELAKGHLLYLLWRHLAVVRRLFPILGVVELESKRIN
jgi:hypothetical protein